MYKNNFCIGLTNFMIVAEPPAYNRPPKHLDFTSAEVPGRKGLRPLNFNKLVGHNL